MCGIWAAFGIEGETLNCVCNSFNKISHRGPDAIRIEYDDRVKNGFLGFHRLAIVDTLCGMQPMRLYEYPNIFLLCNGELYNYKHLKEQYNFNYVTKCDIEIIIHLYKNVGYKNVTKALDGVFAFCLTDMEEKTILIGRDPYGVRPLFRLLSKDGQLAVCSESKGLMNLIDQVTDEWTLKPFPPGHYEKYQILPDGKVKLVETVNYYKPGDKPSFIPRVPWPELVPSKVSENIRKLLSAAVEKRLMADRRIGCLLSGGLDSSLVAALLVKFAKEYNLPYKIQSFAIGMGDSPDIQAAREVADYIGTDHHEVIFTSGDVANVLDEVIYTLETFDITTIRASIGMYILARYIKRNTSTTVIFSGEGADEVAQGYIYFRDAPNAHDAHEESLRLLQDIYLYDGLRADRTTSAHSLELRVPFLDLQFTHYYLSLDPESRQPQNGVEKHLLRSAFDDSKLLPNNILWRHKEAFSDGVASIKKSLFEIIQDIVEERVSNDNFESAPIKYPHCTPKTKEAFYYRQVFEKYYPNQGESFTPYFWMPRWVKNISDPSARFIKHYAAEKK
ncbi:asparagine synthetase [glutamine-hydrolyzing] [Chelonus insularis]|uniref:asparagine synthetase [glutamine-hydrolyzing] n=1 Tax=Chelonus insularis TaxID=460826 RepID=UPI00158F53DE|nr:asparagine synthetase [glutamine-hydrolyzing] [Chelonus insularis]XP_034945083.1 asparagine synthetase [glutamine-hydrolyzing] [Chelonus insularis]XP_034945089.1 asparagine synthetase [glutamine-hydrolyzing] [Chelonus insularis]XP_034945099.1 asparagine synthetase [glutamine-hydrolyzing] [Chelonus insularis]XP_034945107.1 asparagine synthetase [glutamine-hydrolyzing] [Chelonus insularis]